MINELLLLSGNDIPFNEARITIHQPTIKEIAYIGEETFYLGCEFLRFSKNKLSEEDRINLEKYTDFDILLSILRVKEASKQKICVELVLALLFPNYTISFKEKFISLLKDNEEYKIDNSNFNIFKQKIIEMFCLNSEDIPAEYNPEGDLARKIADKLNKRKQQLAKINNGGDENKKFSILSKYISILSVGEKKDMNSLILYTVYQLNDEYKRFILKEDYDMYIKLKIAGSKDDKDIDH